MAHKQCKVQTIATVEKYKKDDNTYKEVYSKIAKESDIPALTIKRWHYEETREEEKKESSKIAPFKLRYGKINQTINNLDTRITDLIPELIQELKKMDDKKKKGFKSVTAITKLEKTLDKLKKALRPQR